MKKSLKTNKNGITTSQNLQEAVKTVQIKFIATDAYIKKRSQVSNLT